MTTSTYPSYSDDTTVKHGGLILATVLAIAILIGMVVGDRLMVAMGIPSPLLGIGSDIINWFVSLFPHAAPVVQHARIVVPS
jgi:hypothetical protein